MSIKTARAWLLEIAAEVEQRPERWTQYAWSRDELGIPVPLEGSVRKPGCWCAAGFVLRDLSGRENDGLRHRVTISLRNAGLPGKRVFISTYNDSLPDAAAFVAWFRRAADIAADMAEIVE